MIKIFLNGVNLSDVPVTQNGYGKFYKVPDTKNFWRTTIDKFDDATPPSQYKTYTDGSHKYCQIISPVYTYPKPAPQKYLQLAYDFQGLGKQGVTMSESVKITARAKEFVKVKWGIYDFWIGHLDMRTVPKVGATVSAGKVIGKLLASNAHLHIYSLKNGGQYPVKDIILKGDNGMKPGDKIEYNGNVNLRTTPSTSGSKIAMIQSGAVGIVKDGPITANGYTWYFLDFVDISGWAVVGTKSSKDQTYVNGDPYVNYEAKYKEQVKLNDKLEQELEDAMDTIDRLQVIIEQQKNTIEELDEDIKALIKANEKLIDVNEELLDDIEKKDGQIKTLTVQLAKCKENCNTDCSEQLAAAFKWFTKTLNKLWTSFLSWLDQFIEKD